MLPRPMLLRPGPIPVRASHEEVFEAGDAFYVGPGHVPAFEAGTETIQFSPTNELKATDAAIRQYMEANA